MDNAVIERFWWTLKYEHIYPRCYENGRELWLGLKRWIEYYNHGRKHSSLNKYRPAEVLEALASPPAVGVGCSRASCCPLMANS